MSLWDILGLKPDNLAGVGDFLKKYYVENGAELTRMAHARLLDDFYDGVGDDEMKRVINTTYSDPENRKERIAVIDNDLEKYDNIIARIVGEKATVYSEPARRKIAQQDETYQEFNERVGMDAVMGELDKKLALHENALIWYRVRMTPTEDREPLLEIVSPASFWAVSHPNDRTLLVAIIFDQRMPLAGPEAPSFRVWTHDQTFVMNGKCEIFESSIESWPLGQMPGLLASLVKPGVKPTLLESRPALDLLSAQKNIRLQAINLVAEGVSVVRQVYASGDTSTTAMGQRSSSRGEVVLGEGVNVQALDRGVDLGQFRETGGYVGDAVASNHGLSPSVLRNRDASSGAEIELRRLPIREQRKKRIPIMRAIEKQIVKIIAMVNSARTTTGDDEQPMLVAGDLPEFAFSADGWSIDFAEVQQAMTEKEKDDTYEQRKRMQLTDPVEEEMRRNPDLKTMADAEAAIKERIRRNTWFVTEQKDLMAASGALGAAAPKTPFEVNRGEPDPANDNQDNTAPKKFPFAVKK